MRSASVASMMSARNTSSLARCRPMSLGKIQEPPKSILSPRLENISENRARSEAITRSQPSAKLRPAPAATPFTAARVGLCISWRRRAHCPTTRIRATDAPTPPSMRSPASSSVRSAPEQKASPAPVITSTRSSGLLSTSSNTDRSSPHIAPLIAFFLAGRLRVSVTTPSRRSTVIVSI